VFDRLVRKITEESKGHIGTGLVGGQWLNGVLSDFGRPDLTYRFATNITYPSWGYMMEKGATTVWELWNGDSADPAMNSGNHVMLVGDLVIWLNERLAGIRPDPQHPGFKHIVMRPTPVGDLQHVRATHNSPHGTILSEWNIRMDRFVWDVRVPVNSTATLCIPAKSVENITESGVAVRSVRGLRFIRMDGSTAVFEAGSGTYHFSSLLP
jgi:alpha-L-rhamnosidase